MRYQANLKSTALIWLFLGAALFTSCSTRQSTVTYEFTNVTRGTLVRTISASGTINPVSTVRVLPQMSGKVENILVNRNDQVQKGDILAELNTDMLRLRREQQLAHVLKARANYELQLVNYQNQLVLAERNFISDFELRSSETILNNLAADLAVAEANLRAIDTEIHQFAFITSPIDGIVLDRRINIGDTVVDSSSSNSSSIFTLAENLREMQIEAMVSELDIASIRIGQMVRFTLESMPGRTFTGEVEKIHMIPEVSNNVVSYTVIISVDNLDGSILPGMTCAVDFIVEHSRDVLMVSNAALRYQPTNLSEEIIASMVFNASLQNMNEEQQRVAMAMREVNAQNASVNGNAGLTNLMMGGGQSTMGGVPGGQGGQGRPGGAGGPGGMPDRGQSVMGQRPMQGMPQSNNSTPAAVMRNLWFINGDGRLDVMQVQVGITSGSFTEIHVADDFESKQVILRERI